MIDRTVVIAAEAQRLADVLADTDPGARVPTCPDWTAHDLLAHVVEVHDFWAHVIGDRLDAEAVAQFEKDRPPLPRGTTALLAARADATQRLLTALRGRDWREPAWSWFPPDQTVDFTWRMQTHEATMHRVDAELAAGRPVSPIDPVVAAEGVDHVLDVMGAWVPQDAQRTETGLVQLCATDSDRTWLVRTFRWSGTAWGRQYTDEPGWSRGEGEPAAVVRGTAEELDLLVWGRSAADSGLHREGDADVLEAFQDVVAQGIG